MTQTADEAVLAMVQTCNKMDQLPHDKRTRSATTHTIVYKGDEQDSSQSPCNAYCFKRRSNLSPSLTNKIPSKGWQSRAEEQIIGNEQVLMGTCALPTDGSM